MKKEKTNKMTNYPVGDFLIRVKNVAMAGGKQLATPYTKLVHEVAKTLKEMGYLAEVTQNNDDLIVNIAYDHKQPVLMGLELISRPGLRRYVSVSELESFKGPESHILSTPKGILSSKEAIKGRIGGELIVKVW